MAELQSRVDDAAANFTSGAYVHNRNESLPAYDAGYARACRDILSMEGEHGE